MENPNFHTILPDASDQKNKYILVIKQQPQRARLCNFKEKVERRPLDPPPIVQLFQKDSMSFSEYHNSPNFFVHITLIDPKNYSDIHYVNGNQTISGSVVQSLHKLKDNDSQEGAFFIFSDVSIRIEGIFALKFTLFQIKGQEVVRLCSVFSDPFRVYSPKAFPGMTESTDLIKTFANQGVRIRVRKESRPPKVQQMKRKRTDSDTNQFYRSYSSSSSPKEEDMKTSASSGSGNYVMSMQNLLITDDLPPSISDQTNSMYQNRVLLPFPQTLEPSLISPSPTLGTFNHYYYTSSPSSSEQLLYPLPQQQEQRRIQQRSQHHQPNINLPPLNENETPYTDPNDYPII